MLTQKHDSQFIKFRRSAKIVPATLQLVTTVGDRSSPAAQRLPQLCIVTARRLLRYILITPRLSERGAQTRAWTYTTGPRAGKEMAVRISSKWTAAAMLLAISMVVMLNGAFSSACRFMTYRPEYWPATGGFSSGGLLPLHAGVN